MAKQLCTCADTMIREIFGIKVLFRGKPINEHFVGIKFWGVALIRENILTQKFYT